MHACMLCMHLMHAQYARTLCRHPVRAYFAFVPCIWRVLCMNALACRGVRDMNARLLACMHAYYACMQACMHACKQACIHITHAPACARGLCMRARLMHAYYACMHACMQASMIYMHACIHASILCMHTMHACIMCLHA